MSVRLLLSCGEPSGDLYAGALTRELRKLSPDITIKGLGGPQFAAAGGVQVEDFRGMAVTGLTEAVAKLPRSLAMLSRLVDAARAEKPDALVLVDFPDFNFRLARPIKALGVRIVYHVSPQLWAWRPGRMKTMREIADRVLVIFPFEEALYRDAGVPVEFVGHPLVDLISAPPRAEFLRRIGLDPDAPTIALLPGSRTNEVRRILPDLLRSVPLIRERMASAQFMIARAPGLEDDLFAGMQEAGDVAVRIVEGETDAVLASANVALTASGTATVQAALHDVPMVVVYRLSNLTYQLGKRLVNVDMYAMANLIAGKRIVPELIQTDFTPERAAGEAVSMLTDPVRSARVREGLALVRERLGPPGASHRAAHAVLNMAMRRDS